MTKYLKKSNQILLILFLLWNIAVYISVNTRTLTFLDAITGRIAALKAKDSLFYFLSPLILVVACGILPASWKATLVFWRFRNALPGCRAFSKLAKRDPRIDEASILRQLDPFPASPREENSLWYKWYREVQDRTTVVESHKQFLLSRDLTGIAFLFFILGSLALYVMGSSTQAIGLYLVITATQFLVFSIVARNHGNRFVCNVLVERQTEQTSTKQLKQNLLRR